MAEVLNIISRSPSESDKVLVAMMRVAVSLLGADDGYAR